MLSLLFIACTSDTKETGSEPASEPTLEWEIAIEGDERGAYLSAWGSSAEDLWIVGGQFDAGLVLRGNAQDPSTWSSVELPEGTPLLNWVHGTSSNNVWMGGLSGTLLRWNGSELEDHTITISGEEGEQPINEAFWGVHAISETEAIAVGGESRWGGEQAVIYHWDGVLWSPLSLPEELNELTNLFKVHHDGSKYWLVGAAGAAIYGDATGWTPIPTGFATDLITVTHPQGASESLIVGGRGTGVMFKGNGGASPNLNQVSELIAGINGVFGLGSDSEDSDALIVGERGYGAFINPETAELTELPAVTLSILHAAYGFKTDNSEVYVAAGGNLFTADEYFKGTVLLLNR